MIIAEKLLERCHGAFGWRRPIVEKEAIEMEDIGDTQASISIGIPGLGPKERQYKGGCDGGGCEECLVVSHRLVSCLKPRPELSAQ